MTTPAGLALATLFLVACSSDHAPARSTDAGASQPGRALVLEYADFGPAAMSYTLVGDEWYAWAAPGCFDIDDRFDVHVVVYEGDRRAIERAYPTVVDHADYRLLPRADAVAFLDANIADLARATDLTPLEDGVRRRLESTRARIADAFPRAP